MTVSPTIYVDADACPVKDEVIRVAERFGLPVRMVGNAWMREGLHPLVESIVVDPKPDAADDWIAEHIAAGDVAITADIPLAARCLDAGAAVLGPTGRAFTEADIGMALAMRELKAHLRETGEDRGFNKSFTKEDRSRFLSALDAALRKVV